jgi:hypothetical protein
MIMIMNWKLSVLTLIFFFNNCDFRKNANIECNVIVSKTKINFATCYNGLTISKLNVKDPIIELYPHSYEKEIVYELAERNNKLILDNSRMEVDFYKKSDKFVWRCYKSVEGHTNDDLYSGLSYEIKDSLGNIFEPDTWYLFNFFNPHFNLFIYSDSSLDLKAVKEKLNPNF